MGTAHPFPVFCLRGRPPFPGFRAILLPKSRGTSEVSPVFPAMSALVFTVHIFKEGDTYVAHVPELDVSSCGSTAEQARSNIADAVRGFLEASEQMGTLDEILQEAGYEREGESWRAPEFVALDRLTLSLD